MPYFIEQKNILLVPLASFIGFNKKIAGEKLANLSGKYFEDLLALEEELQEHNEFCEDLLKKVLASQFVADFNLGKKSKHEFISELLSFLNNLPNNKLTKRETADIEAAWNSLLEFDKELLDVFNELIKLTEQGKSIYFIGNTNELHAQKVLDLFKKYSDDKFSWVENLPNPVGALPLPIIDSSQIGSVYFCLSYFYQALIEQPSGILTKLFTPSQATSGLLTQLSAYLTKQGKTKQDILLINPYKNTNAVTKKLTHEIISKDNFYCELRNFASDAMRPIAARLSIEPPPRSTEYIPLSTHP